MRTLGQLVRQWITRFKSPELELVSVRSELSALRNDYLELGLKASMLAVERDRAIAARKKTDAYIASIRCGSGAGSEVGSCSTADTDAVHSTQAVFQPVAGNDNGQRSKLSSSSSISNSKQQAGRNVLDTLRNYFTPLQLHPEAELVALRQELTSLGDEFLELAERTNTIADERDAALSELDEAQVVAEGLTPTRGVHPAMIHPSQDAVTENSGDLLVAAREKLNRTQLEKNDISIKLADSEDRAEALCLHAAKLREHVEVLEKDLSVSQNKNTAASREMERLTGELDEAHIMADRNKRFLEEEITRVRNEYTNAGHNDQQHIQDLERRLAELEPALLTANHTIEDLRQLLADVSYREKYRRGPDEPGEGTGQRQSDSDDAHGSVAPAAPETAAADRKAGNIGWARIAAGFVFIVGVLASGIKLWNMDSQMIYSAEPGREVDTRVVRREESTQSGIKQVQLVPQPQPETETVSLATLDATEIKPADAESRSDQQKKVTSKLRGITSGNMQGNRTRKTIRGSARGGHVRVYLMEENENADSLYDLCIREGVDEEECAHLQDNMFEEGVIRLASGVQYTVIRNGTGATPGPDDTVLVNFRGMLLDGTEFDSSGRHGGASRFRVDEAIPGLKEILQYMEEGAKWEVYIPTNLAFKEPAAFGGQTVVFELELISIEDRRSLNVETEPTQDNTGTISIPRNPVGG